MTFDWSVIWNNADRFAEGATMTVLLAVLTMALAIPGGLLLAFLRMSPIGPVRLVATAFVEFFRATPLILQIYWAFYVMPAMFDVRLSEFGTALVGLVCNIRPSTRRRSAPASCRSGAASGTPAWRSACRARR